VENIDAVTWRIAFPPGSWRLGTEETRRNLLLKVELLEGGRAGEWAWADLVIDDNDDHSAQMTGRTPFSVNPAGPGARE
jgi:hypothetical protein